MSTASKRSGMSPILETLGLFAIVLVLQWIATLISSGLMVGLFILSPPVSSNPWTVVTSVYAHSGIGHLLSNSVALVLFGWPVARATTRVRFHTFFIVTGALAGISQVWISGLFASLTGGPEAGVLGASGAVFALMGYLLAGNRISDGLAAQIQVPFWMTLAIFIVLAGLITLLTASPGVALIAHFTGFLLGLIAGRAGVLEVRTPKATQSTRV